MKKVEKRNYQLIDNSFEGFKNSTAPNITAESHRRNVECSKTGGHNFIREDLGREPGFVEEMIGRISKKYVYICTKCRNKLHISGMWKSKELDARWGASAAMGVPNLEGEKNESNINYIDCVVVGCIILGFIKAIFF